MNGSNEIDVIYLSYVPYGLDKIRGFISSYLNYQSGISHQLIILFNGFEDEKELEPFKTVLNQSNLNHKIFTTFELYDIGAYRYSARKSSANYVMFLNTYSRILENDWLLKLYRPLQNTGVGAVGCTACWGHYCSNQPSLFKIWDLKIRLNFHFRHFPHLRTNAFLIDRKLFNELNYHEIKPRFLIKLLRGQRESKLKTLHFEHGKQGMTNQLKIKGLEVLVCDRFGRTFTTEKWKESSTYRYEGQENLMISDNQTNLYQNANEMERAYLRFCAWNEPFNDGNS